MEASAVVRVAARTLSLYLLVWAVSELVSIPRDIVHVHYYFLLLNSGPPTGPSLNFDRYYLRVYTLELSEHVLRAALWILGALWLFRGNAKVQALIGMTVRTQAEVDC